MNTIIKLTRADLARKSRSQLAAIFQQVHNEIATANIEVSTMHTLVAMIAAEISSRKPEP